MELPKDLKVYESLTGHYWIDEAGIVCSVTKKDPPKLSKEQNDQQTKEFVDNIGSGKFCFLIDIEHAQPSSPEERKRGAEVLNEITNAMALIVHNALGRMVVNLFIGLQKPPYPMKIFKPSELEEAKKWLQQYL